MDGKCLVADSNCDTVDLQCPVFFLQGMANNGRFTFSVGDTRWAGLQLVLSKTSRIGDIK